MNQQATAPVAPQQSAQQPAAQGDDFFSDTPLGTCPLHKDGMGVDEICEACQ